MIRIQNIYYMLAYAFHVLNEEGYKQVATEDFEYTSDLFAAILSKGIASQIKRGLSREYISKTKAVISPAGKINVSASIVHEVRKLYPDITFRHFRKKTRVQQFFAYIGAYHFFFGINKRADQCNSR